MTDLPMPTPTVPNRPFHTFKLLSLDIYGTLIDWESGILEGLKPLLPLIPSTSPSHNQYTDIEANPSTRTQLLSHFTSLESKHQSTNPGMRYADLLPKVYLNLASDFSIPFTPHLHTMAIEFGQSIGTWPPFPDTVDAMLRLSKYFSLVPLSNVDRDSFSNTCAGPLQGKVRFWRVVTAEDVGSYKPDLRNFRYLLDKVGEEDGDGKGEGGGLGKGDVLHVAQSLFHDHRPAKVMGMSSVWINRKGAAMGSVDGVKAVHERGEVGYGWRYNTLGEFADEVEKQFAERDQ